MHFVIAGNAGDEERIQNESIGIQIAAVDYYTQFVHRCHFVVMGVTNTHTRHRETASQLYVRDVIQTAVHVYGAVQFGAETAHIEIILYQRQHYVCVYVIKPYIHRIAVGLHLVSGYDTYPSAGWETELQAGIGLRVVEIKTRHTERDILQFPLLVGDDIAVADRTVVDPDIIQEHFPSAGSSVFGFFRNRIVLGEPLNDVGEIKFVVCFQNLSVESVQMDSAYLHPLGYQLRPGYLDIETVKGHKIRLAVGFLALEAADTDSSPEGVDYYLVGVKLPAYYLFALCINDMRCYRRKGKYQCKEEHYC